MHSDLLNANDLGVVYKKTIGTYFVHSAGRVLPCSLSNRLRKQLIYPIADPSSLRHRVREVKELDHTDPVAIGDQVRFMDAGDGSGMIVEILPRRNKLARQTAVPMPDAEPFEQVFAANIDQVIPVFAAASPAPKWNMLDRYLVLAEAGELPALICINKIDLAQSEDGSLDEELHATVDEYRRIGYQVMLISAVTGEGLEEFKQALAGRVSVFLGKSGVGKTSLLNAIEPGLGLRVKEVSQYNGKGRHTTTHLEMSPLTSGGAIIDTPGVREFGLWGVGEDDLAQFFPEMRPFLGKCRFRLDCQHEEEPGCAIRKAVMDGHISPRRFFSYVKLREES